MRRGSSAHGEERPAGPSGIVWTCCQEGRPTESGARTRRRQREPRTMCRNIRPLFNVDPPATDDEVRAAALQYVRKISGFTKPSRANEEAFDAAVEEIATASARLLAALETIAPPRDREVEAARAKARAALRYGT